MANAINVTGIYRYPVKGLSPQRLAEVALDVGETLAFDRAWAIENGPGRFDPDAPRHLPKMAFLNLMRDERLATITTEFDEATTTLTVFRGGKQVTRGDLTTKVGRSLIEQFMAAYMQDSLRGPPRIVSAPGHSFSDVAAKCLHIINLATVADLERVMGRTIDPLRFRPNVIITGAAPWAEFDWLGRELRLGTRGVRVKVTKRVVRCPATNVDPDTGARDADIPARLQLQWGHTHFGVYATVSERGILAVGDTAVVPAGAAI